VKHRSSSRILLGLVFAVFLVPLLQSQVTESRRISQLIRQNRFDDAEKQLWEVLTRQPDQPSWALRMLGTVRLHQNRSAEAEALFQKVLTLNSRDVEASRGLGDAYRAQSQSDKAIVAYSNTVKLAPADVASHAALAILYQQAGDYAHSIEAVERIPPAARPPQLLPVLAADYFGTNQPAKIGPLIHAALRYGAANLPVVLDFDAVLVRNGYLGDADHLLQAVKPAKPSAEYLRAQSRVREAQGQRAQARDLLAKALKLQPKSFDLLFDSARLAVQDEKWDDAVQFLRLADQAQPDRPDVLLKLSLALLKTRRHDAAVAVARKLVSIQPDNPDNQYVLASTLVSTDLFEQASPIAHKLAQQRPNDANVQLLLATVQFNMGHVEDARKSLERCLALDPKMVDARYYFALIAQRQGDYDSARKELEQVVKVHPDHAAAQAELGMLQLRAGDVAGARTALETAVKLRPDVSQSHYQLGLVYGRLGLQEQASAEMATYQKLRQAEDDFRRREAGLPTSGTPPRP
jgi:tetratricopeptide (TPR) repeat protein